MLESFVSWQKLIEDWLILYLINSANDYLGLLFTPDQAKVECNSNF